MKLYPWSAIHGIELEAKYEVPIPCFMTLKICHLSNPTCDDQLDWPCNQVKTVSYDKLCKYSTSVSGILVPWLRPWLPTHIKSIRISSDREGGWPGRTASSEMPWAQELPWTWLGCDQKKCWGTSGPKNVDCCCMFFIVFLHVSMCIKSLVKNWLFRWSVGCFLLAWVDGFCGDWNGMDVVYIYIYIHILSYIVIISIISIMLIHFEA